jgi:hypothetical protein
MLLAFVNDMAVRAEGACNLPFVRQPADADVFHTGHRNMAFSEHLNSGHLNCIDRFRSLGVSHPTIAFADEVPEEVDINRGCPV